MTMMVVSFLLLVVFINTTKQSSFYASGYTVVVGSRQRRRTVLQASTTKISDAVPTTTSSISSVPSSTTTSWFPTRIQETLDYHQVVSSLYLRHVVTETQEMAQAALDYYLKSKSPNAFAETAAALSACTATKQEGGKIGWVSRNEQLENVIPSNVVEQLFQLEPKAGDVHLIFANETGQWHVIQVLELWMNEHVLDSQNNTTATTKQRIGAFKGQNMLLSRRKLKGSGVLPEFPQLQSYVIMTTGCQMNVADSERLEGILQHDLGLTVATTPHQADLIVLNTCSIREHAQQKLYNTLGPFAAAKRTGKRLALVVTGCVAQQEGHDLIRQRPEIDAVLGPQYIPHFKQALQRIATGQQLVATAPMLMTDNHWDVPPLRGHQVRAWVNVIAGCNEHCTYCVVPATRGMEVSRTPHHILKECLELRQQGYKEVTLLGQNIDAYGRDMIPKRTFSDLLEFLNQHLPGMRIRYVTSHPRYFSDRVIQAVAHLENVCECFHLPFQAGDDEVLKRMRRGYTYNSYMRIINKIRATAPDAALTADVIVGFPGETDKAFEKTLQLMQAVKFDNINSFAYSPRPNTEAALMEDQIDDQIKSERLQRVQQLATEHALERSERYVGRACEVLVEDVNPRHAQQVMGRTRQGRPVYFDGDVNQLMGEFVNVTITKARPWSLSGVQWHR